MRRLSIFATTTLASMTLALGAPAAWAADPVGHYNVTGTKPSGGPGYSGRVTVLKTGDTYNVIWVIGGTDYVGIGVGNEDFLTVSYRSGDDTGVALYVQDRKGWKGLWTYAGGTRLGTEHWTRD